jgi:hypothetical protein
MKTATITYTDGRTLPSLRVGVAWFAGEAGWCRLTFLWLSAAGYASWLTTVRLVRPVTGGA